MATDTWVPAVEALGRERLAPPHQPKHLTVVYDPLCQLCRRCRDWMLGQPAYIPIRFVACSAEEAQERFGSIPWLSDELVVVSDACEVWVGPAAFLTCLWALEYWREWSYTLAGPAFAPLAERFFHALSARRGRISAFFAPDCADGSCRAHGTPSMHDHRSRPASEL